MGKDSLHEAAAILGRKGGSAKTEAKARAARENGKKGGRPRKGTIRYMHKETGVVADKEIWVASYDPEELAERGLTAQQAFFEDLYITLIPVVYDGHTWIEEIK